MSKYIDADKLIAEIEKRLKNVRDYMNGAGMKYKGPKYFKAQGKESSYDALLSLITSLQQEQPQFADASKMEQEVDLEKKFTQEYATYHLPDFILGTLCDGTGVIDFIYKTARHFWDKGYNTRKEE